MVGCSYIPVHLFLCLCLLFELTILMYFHCFGIIPLGLRASTAVSTCLELAHMVGAMEGGDVHVLRCFKQLIRRKHGWLAGNLGKKFKKLQIERDIILETRSIKRSCDTLATYIACDSRWRPLDFSTKVSFPSPAKILKPGAEYRKSPWGF